MMLAALLALALAAPVEPDRCRVPRHAPVAILCEGEPAPRAGFLIAAEPMDRATACLESQAAAHGGEAPGDRPPPSFFVAHPIVTPLLFVLGGLGAGVAIGVTLDRNLR